MPQNGTKFFRRGSVDMTPLPSLVRCLPCCHLSADASMDPFFSARTLAPGLLVFPTCRGWKTNRGCLIPKRRWRTNTTCGTRLGGTNLTRTWKKKYWEKNLAECAPQGTLLVGVGRGHQVGGQFLAAGRHPRVVLLHQAACAYQTGGEGSEG